MSAVIEAREPSAKYLSAMQQPLVQHFELLATAHGGVAKLRELILTLAVQGKLVPQDPSDEPASELLNKIRQEKDRLIAEGKIKREKPLPKIAEEEKPFDLPRGWEWVRLDRLSTIGLTDGDWIETKDQDPAGAIRLVQLADIGDGFFKDKSDRFISVETCEKLNCTLLKQGDVLIARLPNPVGRSCVFPGLNQAAITAVDVAICRIEGDVAPEFVSHAINAPATRALIGSYGKGATRFRVSTGHLKTLPLAIPPRAEQSRIVTRVEELMRLCDALEAKGQLEVAQHAQLVQTLLGALTASATPEELADNWQRVATHFDVLLDRPEAIDTLEQTILQLAVRGLLVPQDPKDEPASELLKKIRAEKDRLIAEGKIKRDKPLAANIEIEAPFALPLGWERVTIDTLASVGSGTTPSRDNSNFFSGGTIPWITSGETGKSFISETAQYVTEAALAQTSLTVYPVGTLIVAMYGQGKTRGQVSELQIEATTNQACAAIVLVEPSSTHRSFVKLVFEKSYEEMRELSAGGAQPNLNVGKIKATQIPLPPMAEQARIVARVESLRCLCADLRQRLAAHQTTQANLAEALIDEVA